MQYYILNILLPLLLCMFSHMLTHMNLPRVCSADKWAWKWNTQLKWWSTVLVCWCNKGLMGWDCELELLRYNLHPVREWETKALGESVHAAGLQHSAFEEKTFATWQFFKIANILVAKNVSCASPEWNGWSRKLQFHSAMLVEQKINSSALKVNSSN